MEKELTSLDLSNLTNLEADRLVTRLLTDITTVDEALLTDAGFNAYRTLMAPQSADYKKALVQVQKNDDTAKIEKSDAERDKAYRTLVKAVRVSLTSDVEAEVDAAKSLDTLLKTYGNVPTLNLETESSAIERLLTDLASDKYKAHVTTLGLDKYIIRLKNAEAAFTAKFSTRMQDTAAKEVFDTKALRATVLSTYKNMVEYVLAMAKSPAKINLPLFDGVLALINTARKYYHDYYATPKSSSEPTTPSSTENK